MKLDDVIKHCRSLEHTSEDVKWGSVLAFSIGRKMYCCISLKELLRLVAASQRLVYDGLPKRIKQTITL